MTNRTAWTPGIGGTGAWTAAFASTDFTSAQPTNGQCLLSTVTIANVTNLDMYMEIGVVQSIASSTIAAGANISFWLAPLLPDGSTYFPPLTAGTAGAAVPPGTPCAVIPLYAATGQTVLSGYYGPIILPAGNFRLIEQNNSGFTYTATTQIHSYRMANINLNN